MGRKYLRILARLIPTGGTINATVNFNSDTGANYSYRVSRNGASDGVQGNFTTISAIGTPATSITFLEADVLNFSSIEKQMQLNVTAATAGAANAPDRNELIGKWANTSNQITTVTLTNAGTGDYAIGSEIVILGHD